MEILGIIPARYQSSRFPGKPLTDICGKPMIWWVYNQAVKVKDFYDVIVATDDERIFNCCNVNGINVMMTSDKHRTGTDRLGEIAMKTDADFYVNIQGDEPLIKPDTIASVIEYKKMHPETEVINSMTKILNKEDIENNTVVKVVSADNDDLIYLSRSRVPYPKNNQEITYYKHLGLYGLSKDALLFFANSERTKNEKIEDVEMLRFLENGYRIKIVSVDSLSIGVDRIEDVKRVEEIIKSMELLK